MVGCSSPLLGLTGHCHTGGLSLWTKQLGGPATEPSVPSAACWSMLRSVQPPRLMALEEVQGFITSSVFFP